MKNNSRFLKSLRYFFLAFVIVLGFITIVATGGGDDNDGTNGLSDNGITNTDPVCSNPNLQRGVISEELEIWHNWLNDGGFEEGTTEVVISDHPNDLLEPATLERNTSAARTGDYGYAITAGPGEGITFSIKSYLEKGDDVRFSFWVRSLEGEASLKPIVTGGSRGAEELFYMSDTSIVIGSEWMQAIFEDYNKNLEYAMLSLDVGPDTTLYLDDFQVEQHIFQMADYSQDESRIVGGIPVPSEPVAPLHIAVLIHIEDPNKVHVLEEYFWQQTAVFLELGSILHNHGGFLTIQPEEDWVMASDVWHPGLLAELVQDYNVVYSTHTHGPHCRDDEGRLRSYSDCKDNQDWDQTPNDYENPYVIEYVTYLHDLIANTSGTQVTDHNGNWEFDQASKFSEIPMLTWSAYKEWRTQSTYDVLINNPWRPTECNADEEIEKFLTHDPDTEIIYIPGWGQNIARYNERLKTRMSPLISQFIYYADPDRVNTFYVVTHVGSFYPRDPGDEDTYIIYDEGTGEFTYSDEFQQDLQCWDEMLTELIDPLVAGGYLEWTSLPEMGELYIEWENNCDLR